MQNRILFLGLLLGFMQTESYAHTLALIRDVDSESHNEAITASTRGSQSLFYNPACLAMNHIDLHLAGIEVFSDKRILSNSLNKSAGAGTDASQDVKKAFDLIATDKPIEAFANLKFLELVVPYVAVEGFASTSIQAAKASQTGAKQAVIDLNFRSGIIMGAAVRLGDLAIGYSKYFLLDSSIKEKLSESQITRLQNDFTSIPMKDFTSLTLGNATGGNAGILYTPLANNPSAIGVSVLNIGGSKFQTDAPKSISNYQPYKKNLETKLNSIGLQLDLPSSLPQIVNAGILASTPEDWALVSLAVDYDDIFGKTLGVNKKLALSSELGISFPDKLAMAYRVRIPIDSKKIDGIYVGLMGLKITLGYRPHDSYAYGVSFLGHAGIKLLSFLKFGLQFMQKQSLEDKSIAQVGANSYVALTFISNF